MTGEQLKKSILQYAIEGKLVPQYSSEEPASELIERIKKEKKRLIEEKIIKKDKNESTIYRKDGSFYEKIGRTETCIDDEIPFEIPKNWEWVRLGNIAVILNGDRGKNYPGKEYWIDNGIPFINAGALNDGELTSDRFNYISEERYNLLNSGFININDILYCLRGSLGKFSYNLKWIEGAIASSLCIIRLIEPKCLMYLCCMLNTPLAKELIKRISNGTAQPNLSAIEIKKYLIPLPPLEEQHRIIEKINQILPLVEQYGESEIKLKKLNAILPDKLRKSILQYAIEGKVVPQIATEEPAKVLLQRITLEKKRLIAEKVIKKDKNESTIYRKDCSFYEKIGKTETCIDDEIPFKIPDTWEWSRLSSICTIIMGASPKGNSIGELIEGIEFHQGKKFFGSLFIEKSNIFSNMPIQVAEENSILLSVRAPVGAVNITDRKICIGRGLVSIKPIKDIDLFFLVFSIMIMNKYYNENSTGTTFKAITAQVVKDTLIPIPPLEEQYRIVEKVELLLSEVDKLKNSAL